MAKYLLIWQNDSTFFLNIFLYDKIFSCFRKYFVVLENIFVDRAKYLLQRQNICQYDKIFANPAKCFVVLANIFLYWQIFCRIG
jgi:hypothetical protein